MRQSSLFTCALGIVLVLVSPVQGAWRLIWSDEFNGPANAPPDPSKWNYDLGNNNGWGNHERETYTNRPENAHMDGQGSLVIHVETTPSGYTSARLKTQGLFALQYGRIEARIKLPSGQGIWPTFWMLGSVSPQWVGLSAAKLTSWRILGASLRRTMEACMALAIRMKVP